MEITIGCSREALEALIAGLEIIVEGTRHDLKLIDRTGRIVSLDEEPTSRLLTDVLWAARWWLVCSEVAREALVQDEPISGLVSEALWATRWWLVCSEAAREALVQALEFVRDGNPWSEAVNEELEQIAEQLRNAE